MKNLPLRALCLALLSLSYAAAGAAEPPAGIDAQYSPEYTPCMEKGAGETSAMVKCMSEEQAKQDKRLQTAYDMVLERASAGQKAKLEKAQQAWVAFRAANAEFYNDPDNGETAHLSSADMFLQMTAERALD
ncbi:MAG: lysozyme inhibitor LprI family protein, partial [Chthoniobacterales bacterium]